MSDVKFTKSDIKLALRAVSWRLLHFIVFASKLIGVVLGALLIFVCAVYIITHYFWQCFVVVGLLALASWFYVELLEAKLDREHEEFQDQMRKRFKD